VKMKWTRFLIRLLACYLVGAAIHTVALLVAMKPPHSGMGPLIVFGLMFFWASPIATMVQLVSEGGYDPVVVHGITAGKAMLFFIVPFVIALPIAFRRELALWRSLPPHSG
jgi:hypothetical protein